MSHTDNEQSELQRRLEERVAGFCAQHALLPPRGTVVVAVSGGADSLCLLGILVRLTAAEGPFSSVRLVIAHLDHGLRGAESEADAHYVERTAEQLDLPFRSARRDVAVVAQTAGRGLEDAARRVRYAFLREVASDVGAERICIGHTRDDQVETLVMRWLRGSGLTGLTGMRPLAGDLARLLLCLTRDETHAYCAARGWAWREDASNQDTRFWRNRLRREVLPVLLRENPNLSATLTRTAEVLAGDEAFLREATADGWQRVVLNETRSRISFDRAALATLHPALRARVLRHAAERLSGGEQALEWRHVEMVLELAAAGAIGRRLVLPHGLRAELLSGILALTNEAVLAPPASATSAEVELRVPGAVEVPGTTWRVSAELLDAREGAPPPGAEASSYGSDYTGRDILKPAEGTAQTVGRAQTRAYLDADMVGLPLRVRTWRPGDRFRPLGMHGEKKLQDYFVDARVPRSERGRVPLVLGADHVLWVAGHRLDDRARLRPETQRVLALRLEPVHEPENPTNGQPRAQQTMRGSSEDKHA